MSLISIKFQLVDMFPITDKSPKPVDMFLDTILRTGSGQWTSSRLLAQV